MMSTPQTARQSVAAAGTVQPNTSQDDRCQPRQRAFLSIAPGATPHGRSLPARTFRRTGRHQKTLAGLRIRIRAHYCRQFAFPCSHRFCERCTVDRHRIARRMIEAQKLGRRDGRIAIRKTTTQAKWVADKRFPRDDRRRPAHGGAGREPLQLTLTSASSVAESSHWATWRTGSGPSRQADAGRETRQPCFSGRSRQRRIRLSSGTTAKPCRRRHEAAAFRKVTRVRPEAPKAAG